MKSTVPTFVSHKIVLAVNNIGRLKKLGLTVIVILTFQIAFSQENYIPGHIVKNNKDTLFGFVDYRNWKNNPDNIKFKITIESNPISFTPTDILEFRIQDEIYVSGIINTAVSPQKTNYLDDNPILDIKVDTTFLQTLFSGKKSLYYYKNFDGAENFYIKQDTGFQLLMYKKYTKQHNDKQVIKENKRYLGQLTLYLNDCETISSKLEAVSYKQKSLIKLFQYYYECSSSDIYYQKKIKKVNTEIGVLAGASFTFLDFTSVGFDYLVNAGYNPSMNFSTGLFFDIILPKSHGKWSIYNELQFTTYKVEGKYEEYENENSYSVTTSEIGYSYIKINNLVRFKYPIGSLFIFINGGISNGFSVSETNYKKKETKFYSTETVVEDVALNDTRKYEQCFILGTGVKYTKFSFEIRFENGNGMSEYPALKSATTRFYFLFGYKF